MEDCRESYLFSPLLRSGEVVNELCNLFGKSGSHGISNGPFLHEELENGWSSIDSSAGWVHQVCQKFVEVYLARRKSSQETYGVQDMYMPCEALLHLVMIVLHNKQPEEVPVIVEFLLKKAIEESELRFLGQAQQLKRSHSKGVEDHAIGSLEDKKLLQREIQRLRSMDHQRAYQLHLQRDELQELRLAFDSLRLESQDAQLGWEEEMEGLSICLENIGQFHSLLLCLETWETLFL